MDKEEGIKPFRLLYKFAGLVFPIVYLFLGRSIALIVTFIFLALYSCYDFARLNSRRFNEWIFNNVGFLLKNKEKNRASTAITFLLGCFIIMLMFRKEIAILSLFIFIVGDAAGNVFGKKFHKIKIFEKSLEGHLFVFAFSYAAGILVGNFLGISVYKVFLGALASTIIQVFPFKLDDNLTMPLAAALVMSLV